MKRSYRKRGGSFRSFFRNVGNKLKQGFHAIGGPQLVTNVLKEKVLPAALAAIGAGRRRRRRVRCCY